eukprot:tig00000523_g1851.t1
MHTEALSCAAIPAECSKRSRVAEPAAAAASPAQDAGTFGFDALPDDVMSALFKSLGDGAGTDADDPPASASSAAEDMAALLEERKLRFARGSEFELRLELLSPDCKSLPRALAAACRIVAAIPRPRKMTVELFPAYPSAKGRSSIDSATNAAVAAGVVSAFLLGMLRALRPVDPDGAAGGSGSGLQSLKLGFLPLDCAYTYTEQQPLPWPPADELRAALAPFGDLRSLDLWFPGAAVGAETAAAIVAACPLLRSVSFRPCPMESPAVFIELGRLAHLRKLVVLLRNYWESRRCAGGIAALAAGPAGASLRRIAFYHCIRVYDCNWFPRRRPEALAESWCLSDDDLLALGHLPALESASPLLIDAGVGGVDAASILALGRAEGLRELALEFQMGAAPADPDRALEALEALGGALEGLPRLASLKLKLVVGVAYLENADDFAALFRSPGVSRALAELELHVPRDVGEAEAAAVAALPALRRLVLGCRAASDEALRPFEVRPPPPRPSPPS